MSVSVTTCHVRAHYYTSRINKPIETTPMIQLKLATFLSTKSCRLSDGYHPRLWIIIYFNFPNGIKRVLKDHSNDKSIAIHSYDNNQSNRLMAAKPQQKQDASK
jgi:hypothetical protein